MIGKTHKKASRFVQTSYVQEEKGKADSTIDTVELVRRERRHGRNSVEERSKGVENWTGQHSFDGRVQSSEN